VGRIKLFVRRNYGYGPLIGLVSLICGFTAGYHGHPYTLIFFVGIGNSLIAGSIAAFLSPVHDEMYQKFLALGIRDIWSSRKAVPDGHWCKWLEGTSKCCTLLGVAHGDWRRDDKFEPALRRCLDRKDVEVHILFLDPNSNLAKVRADEEQRDTAAIIRTSIKIVWSEVRFRLRPELKERLHLYVYDSTPSSGASWFDDFMIVTHYLAGYPNKTSPAFRVEDLGPDSLFDVFKVNIEKIREKHSTVEITEENVAKYV
jgi:hypothetical protein